MNESAQMPAVAQRFVPRDRESFFDAQGRNRRATWRVSALCVFAAVVMGIPLALIITPLLYAVALIVADVVNLFAPLPAAFWTRSGEVARYGLVALGWMLQHKPANPQTLALGAAALLVPGAALSVLVWLGMGALLRRGGVGGALLALQAREPNPGDLKELQLADVVQEMAIAAGLPAPRVFLVDAPGANAAAIGTSPRDARIIVSRRMLDDLSRDELEGALAHLIGSIGNGDLRIAFRVAAVFETCGLLVAMINSPFGSRSRRTLWRILRYGLGGASAGDAQEAAAVAEILERSVALETDDIDEFFDTTKKKGPLRAIRNFLFFPIFFTNAAIKLSLWFFSMAVLGPSMGLLWRTRKYLADASAVQLTRNPNGLAAALQKLNEDAYAIPGGGWAAHLFIVKPGQSGSRAVRPDAKQKELLARAWAASAQAQGAGQASAGAADFGTITREFMITQRAAFAGDAQAMARLRAARDAVEAADPALAAQFPDPMDFVGARQGDPGAIARLAATRRSVTQKNALSPAQPEKDTQSSGMDSVGFVGFHPSLKRRLKRLDRMGATIALEAADRKLWIVGAIFGLIFAPFVIAIVALFLLLIGIMILSSLTFLLIWLAVIHQIFAMIAHH